MPAADEFDRRREPGTLLADESGRIARACRDMAVRFKDGATLIAFGEGAAVADARHIAVEFVHPVIVGKRALPAIALAGGALAEQLQVLARPGDVALCVSHGGLAPDVRDALEVANELGLLTIALLGGPDAGAHEDVDHVLAARSDEPLIARELEVTTYHLLWELVHVFLDADDRRDAATPAACITCSDEAIEVRVLELRPGSMALVDTGSSVEEVSVALVDASVGSRILVHAGEAIAALGGGS